MITVKDLAAELGTDRSNLRKWIVQRGIEMTKVRDASTRGQETLAVSEQNAQQIRELRAPYTVANDLDGVDGTSTGVIYAIQPDPDMRPGRVKVGYSKRLQYRLATFRCVAPEATVIRTWDAPPDVESAIHLALSLTSDIKSADTNATSQELFEAERPQRIVERVDEVIRAVIPE